jgi:cytochrome c oxidase subunit II
MRRHVCGFTLLACANAAAAATFQDALTPAGPQASHIYDLWMLMLWVCSVVFVAIMMAYGIALWRAPRSTERTPADTTESPARERRHVIAVSIATAVSTLGLFGLIVASVMTDRALASLPLGEGIVINVTAHQWWWEAMYDDHEPSRVFYTANELHVPVGRPVMVRLRSSDVIHSFWVPNLHGKRDLIPGRDLLITFRADKAGLYRGQCAEFCGHQHAKMAFLVIAQEPEKYERWAAAQREAAREPQDDTQKLGQRVFESGPCIMCHTIQGTTAQGRTGPDLTHLASRRTLGAGTLPNTRDHLAGWIADPHTTKPGVNMPAIALAPDDLHALVAYLESLE